MRTYGRYRRQSVIKRHHRPRWLRMGIFWSVVAFLLWSLWQLCASLFSSITTESAHAILQIHQGRAEFMLAENTKVSPAFVGQVFYRGDTIGAGPASRISLDIFDTNSIFLHANSTVNITELQQRSSGQQSSTIYLQKGQLWAKVADPIPGLDTTFIVETNLLKVTSTGTIFDVSSSQTQDSVRLLRGSVTVEIKDPQGQASPHLIKLGVGQQLIVTPDAYANFSDEKNLIEILDSEFQESDWNLTNLEKFYPQEAAEIRRRIEIKASTQHIPAPSTDPVIATVDDVESATFLSPAPEARIPGGQTSLTIEGTAPADAFQIIVNGYTLTKFQPGDRKWYYFASVDFGTMLPGKNEYNVIIRTRNGQQSAISTLVVYYDAPADENSDNPTSTSSSSNSTNNGSKLNDIYDFSAPVVTRPNIFVDQPEGSYETSAPVVTIAGTVDPKTTAVEVNGVALKKFKPGDSTFTYLANANYGNMKHGKNIYTVVAFGPSQQASTSVTIVYTPLSLSQ